MRNWNLEELTHFPKVKTSIVLTTRFISINQRLIHCIRRMFAMLMRKKWLLTRLDNLLSIIFAFASCFSSSIPQKVLPQGPFSGWKWVAQLSHLLSVCDVCVCVCVCFKTRLFRTLVPRKEAAGTEGWPLGTERKSWPCRKSHFPVQESSGLWWEAVLGRPRSLTKLWGEWLTVHPHRQWAVWTKKQTFQNYLLGIRPPGPPCGPVESWEEVPIKTEIEFSTSQVGERFQLRFHLAL